MATEQRHVIHADDLTDADEAIIEVLREGARTKGAIEDETGLHRNTVGNRLDVLEAGDVVERIHDRTALYELVDDPREGESEQAVYQPGDDEPVDVVDGVETLADMRDRIEALEAERDDLEAALEECREQLAAAEGADTREALAGVRAALSALDGRRPDVDTAVAELERVLEVLGDDA